VATSRREVYSQRVMWEYYLAAPSIAFLSLYAKMAPFLPLIAFRSVIESPGHSYMILAKIADHLLQFCISREEVTQSLFLLITIAKQKDSALGRALSFLYRNAFLSTAIFSSIKAK
jgi:hypothetical protein